ncbi:MAG: acylphosphatase [Candidatus Thermoplasmatota archaeon]|nr:acylphosphatase [Candidatus Thermoplasmatota archaeon]
MPTRSLAPAVGQIAGDRFFAREGDATAVIVRARVVFQGLVQGVFFRANAQERARSLGLTGWVRNLPDGSVEAVFEGEEAAVEDAIDWCATKQPYAKVRAKMVEMSEPSGEHEDFHIVG